MPSAAPFPLVAVDIGNTRIKLGLFPSASSGELPAAASVHAIDADWTSEQLASWLPRDAGKLSWHIASVNRPSATKLLDYLQARSETVRMLEPADLPLDVALPRPDQVGIDRLVGAVAVNALRDPGRPAIVVGVGTAITVDLVSAAGAFQGGAILPGIAMSARALHQFTDLLPLVDLRELAQPPDALGRATTPAIQSGLLWGAVGAIRELVARLSLLAPAPQLFITGGAAPSVADLVGGNGPPARFVPHLTLEGIAIAAERSASRRGVV